MTKEDKPEHQESKSFLDEMTLEDLKFIESNPEFLIEIMSLIHRRARQARQLLEVDEARKEPGKRTFYTDGQSGPWSNALKAMCERERRLKKGGRNTSA